MRAFCGEDNREGFGYEGGQETRMVRIARLVEGRSNQRFHLK